MRAWKSAALILLFLACARREQHPPVILISVDTLRADRVTPALMPHVVALGHDGVVYRNAWSHVPLTLPSHLSMLTGRLPPEHGVRDNAGYRFHGQTVASLLRAEGYRTAAAVSAYVLRGQTGVGEGFETYDDAIGLVEGASLGALQRPGMDTEQIAERWIDAHGGEPFFYFLHLYEPHAPYAPSYDADVRAADVVAGRFLDHLRRSGVYERAVILFVSDHGEGLMEHGEAEHGVFLYREDLHVPLIVKMPKGVGRSGDDDTPAGLSDVGPTILEAAGVSVPKSMTGLSLLHARPDRPLYAESYFPRLHLGWSELRSIVHGPLHVIDAPRGEVYDLRADPGERQNVVARERRAYAEGRALARATAGTFAAPERVDPEEAKKLAALGYVSAGGDAADGELPDPKDVIDRLAQLKNVEELVARGDHAKAIAALTSLLEANPRWSDVREQLGQEYDRSGDHASAARVYQEGITRTPPLAGAFALSAGFSLLQLGRLDDAAAHAGIALSAGESGAHLLLGEIALARKDYAMASREEAAAEASSGQKAHALFLAARVAAAQHDYDRALELLDAVQRERAATGASLPQRFHYVAADALAHRMRFAEAEAEFGKAIAEDAGDARAYADLALLQEITHHRDAAHATLEQLAATHPRAAICLDIAKQLETVGDPAGAAVWRQRARVAR
jgi:tetratricopeptide (TPR) repeat protein